MSGTAQNGPKHAAVLRWPQISARIAASLFGGYAFTWGFAALGMAAFHALGVDFEDAEAGALLLALLVFLCAFLWTFAARRAATAWAVLLGGGALMSVIAWSIQRAIV